MLACITHAHTYAGKDMFLLSGTSVKCGSGTMVVVCVGLFSEEGIINKLITGVGKEETERLLALDKTSESVVVTVAEDVQLRCV